MTEHIPVAIRENIEKAFGDNNLRTDVHLQALIGKDAGGWVAMDDLFVLLPRMKRLVKKRLSALLAAGPPTPGAPKPTLNSVLAGALTSSSVVDIDPSSPVGNGIRRSANLPTSAPTLPMPDAPLKHLVLDSGAIIHGVSTDFHSKAFGLALRGSLLDLCSRCGARFSVPQRAAGAATGRQTLTRVSGA